MGSVGVRPRLLCGASRLEEGGGRETWRNPEDAFFFDPVFAVLQVKAVLLVSRKNFDALELQAKLAAISNCSTSGRAVASSAGLKKSLVQMKSKIQDREGNVTFRVSKVSNISTGYSGTSSINTGQNMKGKRDVKNDEENMGGVDSSVERESQRVAKSRQRAHVTRLSQIVQLPKPMQDSQSSQLSPNANNSRAKQAVQPLQVNFWI